MRVDGINKMLNEYSKIMDSQDQYIRNLYLLNKVENIQKNEISASIFIWVINAKRKNKRY